MAKVGGGGPALLSLVDFFAPSLVGASNVRLTDEVYLSDARIYRAS